LERPYRHGYKKGNQHIGFPYAQPLLMPQINKGDLLQVPGQVSWNTPSPSETLTQSLTSNHWRWSNAELPDLKIGNYRKLASVGAML